MGHYQSPFSSFQQLTVKYVLYKILPDYWIQTVDLWYQKQLLCQLSHNHCAVVELVAFTARSISFTKLNLRNRKWSTFGIRLNKKIWIRDDILNSLDFLTNKINGTLRNRFDRDASLVQKNLVKMLVKHGGAEQQSNRPPSRLFSSELFSPGSIHRKSFFVENNEEALNRGSDHWQTHNSN